MPDLRLQHLIYTRVEPAYSPKNRNGFQTVYFSPEIKDEVDFIERRIQCFSATEEHVETGTPEYQYFWTPKQFAVIVQFLPIEADAMVIDASGRRGGHFVAHALVISADEFAKVGNDTFAVIAIAEKAEVFTDSVPTLVSYLQEEPPAATLKVGRRRALDDDLPEAWVSSLEKWALAAQSAAETTAKKTSLLLLSDDPTLIYTLLSAATFMMDAEHRAACTFNTFIDGCVPAAGAYWAAGARRRVNSSGFHTIEVSSAALDIRVPAANPKASPYSKWLRRTLQNYGEFSVGMPEIVTAQLVARSQAAKQALPADAPLSDRVLTTFREVNLEQYQTGQMTALTDALGEKIARQLSPVLIDVVGIRAAVDVGARASVEPKTFAPALYQWAVRNAANIAAWGDLLKFALAAAFDPLIALAGAKTPSHLLNQRQPAKASAAALDRLAAKGELANYVDELRSALDFGALVTAKTAPVIVRATDIQALDDKGFLALTDALVRISPASIDGQFAERVRRIRDKASLKRIAGLLKKTPTVNKAFAQAVREAT